MIAATDTFGTGIVVVDDDVDDVVDDVVVDVDVDGLVEVI